MSEVEADQTVRPPRLLLRRCSSAICLSEKKASPNPLEHPDLMRVKQLSMLSSSVKSCLKSPIDQKQTGSNTSLNRVRLKGNDLRLNDDVFEEEDSIKSLFEMEPKKESKRTQIIDSLVVIISGIYGILLVVIGAIVPMAETFVHPNRPYAFELYYVYLYSMSISFIIYIYMFLLHDSPIAVGKMRRTLSERGRKKFMPSSADAESFLSETNSVTSRGTRRRRITFNNGSKHSAASFYLRLGAVVFGIGCMILEGLNVGQLIEIFHAKNPCSDPVMMLRPVLKSCFTFSQLFFIFRNSKMVVYKGRTIARFGFMHMAATNICVWFRVIVMETLMSFHESIEEHHKATVSAVKSNHSVEPEVDTTVLPLSEFSCRYSNLIGGMLMESSHYLYPFCIEYSVICAGILYVMWKNIGTRQKLNICESEDKEGKLSHKMSVDCSGSSRGMFGGIFLFVAMVCSMIVYYVISKADKEVQSEAILVHSSEILILSMALAANICAAFRMRELRFTWKTKDMLEETLILISMTGLYTFSVFSLISAMFYTHTLKGVLTIVVHILMMVLATVQTIFLIVGIRLSAKMVQHVKQKPGREFVSFLMLCNLSLWGITTFEMQKPVHNPQQLEFYGAKAWSIFVHISVPLGIFYFFHCTVCLSHIWKHAWKFKRITKL